MPDTVDVPLYGSDRRAMIDASDAARIVGWKWKFAGMGRGYAALYICDIPILMHRYLMDAPDELQVDHINGDGLDNRRCNLRLATRTQNVWNCQRSRPASTFVGVSKKRRKFRAMAYIDGRAKHLGYFATAEQAAMRYDEVVREIRGAFGTFNFPREGERSVFRESA